MAEQVMLAFFDHRAAFDTIQRKNSRYHVTSRDPGNKKKTRKRPNKDKNK